jgi:Mor family transcriptional regulator
MNAKKRLEHGNEFPYDAGAKFWEDESQENVTPPAPKDWAHAAARGVLADLLDRRSVKHPFDEVDHDTRAELTATMSEIIRTALREYGPEDVTPEWVVNSLGELGVRIQGRHFFLYKGDSLEYKDGNSQGHVVRDNGDLIKVRLVGKTEFGETCWPVAWVTRGYREDTYAVDLQYVPGLSFGSPDDPDFKWNPLPAKVAKPKTASADKPRDISKIDFRTSQELEEAFEEQIRQIEEAKKKYLLTKGWKLTCKSPGSYWVWHLKLTDTDHYPFKDIVALNVDQALSFQRIIDNN